MRRILTGQVALEGREPHPPFAGLPRGGTHQIRLDAGAIAGFGDGRVALERQPGRIEQIAHRGGVVPAQDDRVGDAEAGTVRGRRRGGCGCARVAAHFVLLLVLGTVKGDRRILRSPIELRSDRE